MSELSPKTVEEHNRRPLVPTGSLGVGEPNPLTMTVLRSAAKDS